MKLSQSTSNGTFRHIIIQRVHYICNKSKRGEEQTSSTDWEVMAMCLVADSAIEAIRDSASHHTFLFFFLPSTLQRRIKQKKKQTFLLCWGNARFLGLCCCISGTWDGLMSVAVAAWHSVINFNIFCTIRVSSSCSNPSSPYCPWLLSHPHSRHA